MTHIKEFNNHLKNVKSIIVDNKSNKDILKGSSDNLYVSKFLEQYPDNKFAKYLKNKKYYEYQTNVGFSKKNAKSLKKWASLYGEKIVIFDWDGCLSVIEGLYIPFNLKMEEEFEKMQITYDDIVIYYSGGIKRFEMLKNLFIELNNKNVRVFILTNNPVASSKNILGDSSKNNFYKLVKKIIPSINKDDILCGYDDNRIKPITFLKNDHLRNSYN